MQRHKDAYINNYIHGHIPALTTCMSVNLTCTQLYIHTETHRHTWIHPSGHKYSPTQTHTEITSTLPPWSTCMRTDTLTPSCNAYRPLHAHTPSHPHHKTYKSKCTLTPTVSHVCRQVHL
uniref:Uncharacterized protein n=1 Tax=Octopus bimaculoides TaxID=37653 RepID=A0A0L8FIR1_OCTBM